MRAAIALAVLASLALAGVADGATRKRGVQRNYAGARWSPSPDAFGWYATLNLKHAVARDWRRGGFIAETLWSTTDHARTPYGRNRRVPYIQVAVSRGFRRRNSTEIVITQRNTKGTYFEGRSPGPAVKLGQDYSFSIVAHGSEWKVGHHADWIATIHNTGDNTTRSAYAGIESSSSRNSGSGTVKQLLWIVKSSETAGATFPRWRLEADKKHGAKLVRRGPGRVRWIHRQWELRNSFGR
jgi:hypothetical protein